MAEVGAYYVTVMPNMSKFNSALASGAKSAEGIFSRIGSIGIGTALGNALSSGFDTFFGTIDRGISRLDTLESFPRIMENVGIDAEASSRAINTLSDMIDGLPTSLDEAAAATQRFALQNGDVERSAEFFGALNNALLAGGQSAQMQSQALEQVSQAYSKGKPDMIEWRSMMTTMGPALKMVARSWGMSVDEMGEALRGGDKSMDEFMETLVALNTTGIDEFASLSEQAGVSTSNLGTAIDLIGTRFAASWAMILDAIGRENLVGIIDGFTSGFKSSVETYLVPAIESAMGWLEGFTEASQPIQDALSDLGTTIQEKFSPAFDAISQAIADNLPTIEDIVGALTGVIDFFNANFDTIVTFAGAFAAFQAVAALVPIITAIGAAFSGVVAFIGTATGVVATLAEGFMLLAGGAGTVGEVVALVAAGLGTSLVPVLGLVAAAITAIVLNWDSISAFLQELGAGFVELGTWFDTFFGSTVPMAIDTALRAIGDFIAPIPGQIVEAFSNIGTDIGAKFDEVKTAASDAFNAMLEDVRGIPGQVVEFFSGLGSRISSAIGSIHFPTPHVTWETISVAGAKTPFSLPHVSWYAQGGIVNGARLIGVGEAGPELIWPSYGTALDKYAHAIADRMGGTGTAYNLYIDGARVNDDAQIQQQFIDLMLLLQRKEMMNVGH